MLCSLVQSKKGLTARVSRWSAKSDIRLWLIHFPSQDTYQTIAQASALVLSEMMEQATRPGLARWDPTATCWVAQDSAFLTMEGQKKDQL